MLRRVMLGILTSIFIGGFANANPVFASDSRRCEKIQQLAEAYEKAAYQAAVTADRLASVDTIFPDGWSISQDYLQIYQNDEIAALGGKIDAINCRRSVPRKPANHKVYHGLNGSAITTSREKHLTATSGLERTVDAVNAGSAR